MNVAALLLTGGASRRMGQDKASLPGPGGRTLAEHLGALLRAVADPALEVGPGRSGLAALSDGTPGAGPLAAVATGAEVLSERGWAGPVLVVATDMPALDHATLAWLTAHPAAGAVVPVVDERPQPLCARYPVADLCRAVDLVAGGRRAMRDLLRCIDITYAEPPDPDRLADVDTPEAWAALTTSMHVGAASGRPGPVTDVRIHKVRADRYAELPDRVATEEPLEIRAAGPGEVPEPVAVTMRTPGHDFDLAAGFLVTEGLIAADELAAVGYCDAPRTPEERWNTVTVSVSRAWTQPGGRRGFTVGASCGVCGKTSIDQVRLACPVVPRGDPIPASLVSALPDRLRASQRSFELTGGLHAAGLFDRDGALVCAREDIGRHNAVDKVVGHLILQRRAVPDGAVLVVSGRVGFEITQKAAMAGIGVVAAISAPSSLAIQAATRLGVTIAAFVRAGTLTLYTHPERIALPDGQ